MNQGDIDKIIATREENVAIAKRLRAVEHLTNKAIAQRMGVSESVVRVMLAPKKKR
jgi:DNA-binding transcriptional regulator LsrR (DeoR family)